MWNNSSGDTVLDARRRASSATVLSDPQNLHNLNLLATIQKCGLMFHFLILMLQWVLGLPGDNMARVWW